MRYYEYVEPHCEDSNIARRVVVSEQQILSRFYTHWLEKCYKKNVDTTCINPEQSCIDDWCAIHWAYFVGYF